MTGSRSLRFALAPLLGMNMFAGCSVREQAARTPGDALDAWEYPPASPGIMGWPALRRTPTIRSAATGARRISISSVSEA